MNNIAFEFIEVSKIIEEKKILDNISFSVPKGKITAFLGPNGAGKTTTMKIAANLINTTSGEVYLNGELLEKSNSKAFFIPDNPLIYPELTGEEYILFVIDLYDVTIDKIYLENLFYKFKVESYIKESIYHYSLGMKKKLVLLSIFIIKPEVVFLDEYISGIDPINLKEIKDLLIDYVAEGNTIFLSTHQLEVAQTFCHNIVMIDDGRIINSGTSISSVIEQNESLEAYFLMAFKEGGGF